MNVDATRTPEVRPAAAALLDRSLGRPGPDAEELMARLGGLPPELRQLFLGTADWLAQRFAGLEGDERATAVSDTLDELHAMRGAEQITAWLRDHQLVGGSERPAQPGEVCVCGRPAVLVFLGGEYGPVGWCGRSDGGDRSGPCPFCGERRHSGRCASYRLRPVGEEAPPRG